MAWKPVDRSLPSAYLKEQYEAIKWLADHGMAPEAIREAHWGIADMTNKTVCIPYKRKGIRYNWETGEVTPEPAIYQYESVKGAAVEHFFMRSQIYCHWVFIKEKPRSWRPELSVDSLYSVAEIERIIGKMDLLYSGKYDRIRLAQNADV